VRAELTTHLSSYGYTPFLDRISPRHFPRFNWHFGHLTEVRRALARVTRGQCKRLIVSMPPQHGKSSVLTVPYPVYRMQLNPRLRVAVGAYNQTHANRFSRKSRRIAQDVLTLSRERKAVNEWETAEGGYYVAVGKGAGITGLPVDLMILDDPHKDAAEAMSEAERENVWEWWTDSLFTRLSLDAAVVLVMTRWHTQDLAGRLYAMGGWESVVLKGVSDDGKALCPELHPLEQLEEARRHNPISFEALYQQKPLDLEGGFFRGLEKIRVVDAAPTPDQFARRVRAWDLAATEKQAGADPDWTVGALLGKHRDGTFWLLDVVRARLGPKGVRQLIRQTAESDGKGVPIRLEREGGASGKLAAFSIVTEELAGWSAAAVPAKAGKAERAEPWAAQIEAGNVCFVRNGATAAVLDEHRAFPSGAHDDCVDACSLGFSQVAQPGLTILFPNT
jgi:predicted phage terminase large subunit-like protein